MISTEIVSYCRNWVKLTIRLVDLCLNCDRQFDNGHYLCSMLMAKQLQPTYLILQAWNIELSRPRSLLSIGNPDISRGKFAFWRDVIKMKKTEHPVAAGLQWAIQKGHLPENLCLQIADAKVQLSAY